MANLMVAAGMEDEGFERKELERGYNIEEQRLMQKIDKPKDCINEMQYTSREIVGAENAKIGSDYFLNRPQCNTEQDIKELALSFVSPAKKVFYKALDKMGMFRPEKVLCRQIGRIDKALDYFKEVKEKYYNELTQLDNDLSELEGFVKDSNMILADLETKTKQESSQKYALDDDIAAASTSYIEFTDKIEDKKAYREDVVGIINTLDTQIHKHKQFRRFLNIKARSSYNQSELKKVLEAYEQI